MISSEALGWQEKTDWEKVACFERDFHISCSFPFSHWYSEGHLPQQSCNPWGIPPDSKKLQPEHSHLCIYKQSQHISSLGSIQAALHSNALLFLLPDAAHHCYSAFHLFWLSPENFQRGNFLLLWWMVNIVLGGKIKAEVEIFCSKSLFIVVCSLDEDSADEWVSGSGVWCSERKTPYINTWVIWWNFLHDKWIFQILIKGLRNLWKPSFSVIVLEEYIFQIFQVEILVCLVVFLVLFFFPFSKLKTIFSHV